ncbi:MAG TPA: hypothetical protein VJ253_06525 [Dehalococcoidia bacterium]|nr:hypothetical protein [Dehalococcoidia bacterium]
MEENPPPSQPIPLFLVVARILIVSGTSFAAAAAIFFLLAGVWQVGLPTLGAALLGLVLMFLVERAAQ